jgi:DNA-binding CsgD family transcriptional regulator
MSLPEKFYLSNQASAAVSECVETVSKDCFSKGIVNEFAYGRFLNDERTVFLHSQQNLANYLFKNKIHLLAHLPQELVKDNVWYVLPEQGHYSQVLRDFRDLFNLGSLYIYIERHEQYVEWFGYYSDKPNDKMVNTYLNSKESYQRASSLIRGQLETLISNAQRDPLLVSSEMKPNIKGTGHSRPTDLATAPKHLDLLLNVNVLESRLKPFSKREQDCLKLLCYGKTGREMSEELNLSPRTIESYIENIKNKIGCNKKSEIINYLMHGQHSELIPF